MGSSVTGAKKLRPRQRKAIRALVELPTIDAAADSLSIGRTTLYRWLEDPEFRAALNRAEDVILTQSAARLAGEIGNAIDTLKAIHSDPAASAPSRVRAAEAIIKYFLVVQEQKDLAQRLAAIEDALNRP